ncbi:MAG: glycerate kinase type-2 family protein [Candidatus Helarchaeota archaeon]
MKIWSKKINTIIFIFNYKMQIKNKKDLLENPDDKIRELRKNVIELLEYALDSIQVSNLVNKAIDFKRLVNINDFGDDIYIIGAGKASGGMAEEIEKLLGSNKIKEGLVIVPKGNKKSIKVSKIKILEAEHPIPKKSNIIASNQLLKLINRIPKEKSLIIILISGGGSALLTLPPKDISLKDIQELTELVLKSGANIKEFNIIRKHCDQFKGGLLIQKLYPAQILSLLISDVSKYPPEFIASGPTFPDQSTYQDAVNILKKYKLIEKVPNSIIKHFNNGIKGTIEETPKKNQKYFTKTINIVISNIKDLCNAIFDKATERNIRPFLYPEYLEGEARKTGKKIIDFANNIYQNTLKNSKPLLFIAGGETTVTLKGSGKGGRCQELILGALKKIAGYTQAVMAAIGTDGIDGYSDAAGAIIDSNSLDAANLLGLDIQKYLENNDSYSFFKKLGHSLILTGPTGTNVSDLVLFLLN